MAVSVMSVLSRNAWLVASLALLSGPSLALQGNYYTSDKIYAREGPWTISINTDRKSCFMYKAYADFSFVQIGADHRQDELAYFFMVGHESWAFEEARDYAVTIAFDERNTWADDGVGAKLNDFKGVAIEGITAEAIENFAVGSVFNLKIDGIDYHNFRLTGSRKGLAKLHECIAAVDDGRISLEAIARSYGVDVASPPTPQEDEGKRADTPPEGTENGSAGGTEPAQPSAALGEAYYASDRFYAREGNWWIFVTLARKSCSMVSTFDGGVELEVGGDRREGALSYFLAFTQRSWDYEQGKDYEVTIEHDRRGAWVGDGIGVTLIGQRGVAVEGVLVETIDELAAAKTLSLKIGNREHGVFDLSGSRQGVAKLRECMAAVEDGRISLAEIADEDGADTPPPTPPPAPAPAPSPKEDDGKDAPPVVPRDDRDRGGKPVLRSYGSGFFIDDTGYLLTNAHVVRHCGDTRLRFGDGRIEPALIVAGDEDNDLALLKMAGRSPGFARFRGGPPIRLGDSVVVFGYPLAGYLSTSGNLSTGLVASLSGARDNEAEMQISAPIQRGNSGGPVVDQTGHVVGVVVAKSNTTPIDDDHVEVIQNANFAIKADVARAFLDGLGVSYVVEAPGNELKTPDVADIARAFSAQVICDATDAD